jgi:lysine biosynthesis protein LysW
LRAAFYNTLEGVGTNFLKEAAAVVKCPECAAVLDVDEDEVEEGEILSCPECEVELEVVQTHPVLLNVISDEDLDFDEEDEDEDEFEDEDLLEEEDEEDEE